MIGNVVRHALALVFVVTAAQGLPPFAAAEDGHHLLLGAADRLVLTDPDGEVIWEMPWGSIHDIHMTERGTILTARGKADVVEIDPTTKEVVWNYDCDHHVKQPVEVHSFYPLANGIVRIAQSGPSKLVDVNRDGEIVGEMPLMVEHPSLHSDTRLIRPRRQTDVGNGDVVVAHERDGAMRVYDTDGTMKMRYEVPMFGRKEIRGHGPDSFGNSLFSAIQTGEGHFLIGTGNGHSILRVDVEGELVDRIAQDGLADITLSWVTTIEELPSGNWLVGNCHAGPGQPIVLEIEPESRSVVWQLDGYDRFGNDVSSWTRLDAGELKIFQDAR